MVGSKTEMEFPFIPTDFVRKKFESRRILPSNQLKQESVDEYAKYARWITKYTDKSCENKRSLTCSHLGHSGFGRVFLSYYPINMNEWTKWSGQWKSMFRNLMFNFAKKRREFRTPKECDAQLRSITRLSMQSTYA